MQKSPLETFARPAIAAPSTPMSCFDGETSITAEVFFAMLECLMPRANTPPWNALASPPMAHAALMLHRVDGLDPGLYVLLRDAAARYGIHL